MGSVFLRGDERSVCLQRDGGGFPDLQSTELRLLWTLRPLRVWGPPHTDHQEWWVQLQ